MPQTTITTFMGRKPTANPPTAAPPKFTIMTEGERDYMAMRKQIDAAYKRYQKVLAHSGNPHDAYQAYRKQIRQIINQFVR